jgi:hypothetical protein
MTGYSLIELLVTIFITTSMLTMMTRFTHTNLVVREEGSLKTEVQLGLRSLIAMITQELRQAGACLPLTGDTVALGGIDNGVQDSLTERIGKVDPNTLVCVQTAVSQATALGETNLSVDKTNGFRKGSLVYITPDGASGNYYFVGDVSATTLLLVSGVTQDLPKGAGVYAIEQRIYAIDNTTFGHPVLTVAIDGGSPQPLVDWVEEFDVRYYLGPCNLNEYGALSCDSTVSLPADISEWYSVDAVGIKATVRSHKTDSNGNILRETTGETGQPGEYVTVKLRNFL